MAPQTLYDAHVHLHGCLTADDLYTWGSQGISPQQEARLQWFVDEYEAAWGERLDPISWWHQPDGKKSLAEALYCPPGSGGFAKFQACFNLIIAMLPNRNDDLWVLKRILGRQRKLNIQRADYRMFLPPEQAVDNVHDYLADLLALMRQHNQTANCKAYAYIQLSRELAHAKSQVPVLEALLRTGYDDILKGVDFCGDEQAITQADLASIVPEIPNELETCCHVGETFDRVGLESSLQRIEQCIDLGVTRLGHALSLGLDPEVLGIGGAQRSTILTQQEGLAAKVNDRRVAIESCPTSNLAIHTFPESAHPIARFRDWDLNVLVGSDDPGVFGLGQGDWRRLLELARLPNTLRDLHPTP